MYILERELVKDFVSYEHINSWKEYYERKDDVRYYFFKWVDIIESNKSFKNEHYILTAYEIDENENYNKIEKVYIGE